MNCRWRSPWVWTVLILLVACNRSTIANQPAATPATNCPVTDETARQLDLSSQFDGAAVFNLTTQAIATDGDTLSFKTPQRTFVFCRKTGDWAILPPDPTANPTADDPEQFLAQASAFQALQVGDQRYQYRVSLAPNAVPSFDNPPQKVIFELKSPSQPQAIALDLYTVDQLRESGIGYELGVPEIKAALNVGNDLFFAVSSEQGEGFSGLTTLIRYNLTTRKLEKFQPLEIIAEQITDLTATTQGNEIIFWFGTKYSVEGSLLIPAKGLMSYRFQPDAWQRGAIAVHSIHNSPLIGAIPTQLHSEQDTLWAATGNGICKIQWQQVEQWDAWQCWRFALETPLTDSGLPLYRSLLSTVPATTLTPTAEQTTVEVRWWSSTVPYGIAADVPKKGRFEVSYPLGFTTTIPEGAFKWEDDTRQTPVSAWEDHVYWPGEEWHWEGQQFVRGFDEVSANAVGLGPVGMSERGFNTEGIQDTNVLRGDFKLIALTPEKTEFQYFSGWVDDDLIRPYFVVLPSEKQPITNPSPLPAIANQL